MDAAARPRLGLGTVQFGLDYGISNQGGKPTPQAVAGILDFAWQSGIRLLDTAAAYGTSEQVLGETAKAATFDIVTKAGPFDAAMAPAEKAALVMANFHRSLEYLKRDRIYGLLVHSADDLMGDGGDAIYRAMGELRDTGRVVKIGISAYAPEQIQAVIERFDIDLVQAPFNILDQRLVRGGMLGELKRRGIEVHGRSAFLQGLMLVEPGQLGDHFERVRPLLESFHDAVRAAGLSPFQACLRFALNTPGLDVVLCGVNKITELQELVAESPVGAGLGFDTDQFAIDDTAIVHPQNWPPR